MIKLAQSSELTAGEFLKAFLTGEQMLRMVQKRIESKLLYCETIILFNGKISLVQVPQVMASFVL